MRHFVLLDLTSLVHSAAEFGGMMHGTQQGMRYGTMTQGMGWGWMIFSMLFALLTLAILVLSIMALLKYLRRPE